MAGPKHSELPAVVVPQHLWLRSARPVQGKVVQWAVPGALILAGLVVSGTTVRVSLVLAGFAVLLLLPGMVVGRLEQLGREVMAADARRAAELVKELPERPLVRLFAPVGWTALQLALLNLKLGEGQQAAQGFAETAQLCGQPEAVMLVSAQAHAHVLAGERGKARELLQKLAQSNLLGPRDQLDLGIVLLIESKKFKQALSYIEAARKTIGDHPRVLAAQALALQKTERIDDASVLLEQVQIAMKDAPADPVADDLIKRARKGLQDYLEAQLRRERRARMRRTTIVVSSEAAASEIVSGEISAGAELSATETGIGDSRSEAPTESLRRFTHAEPTAHPFEPAPQNEPKPPPAREPDAPQPGLEIDLFSVPHTSAPALTELLANKAEESKPRADSVAAALSEAPMPGPPAPTSLIVPDPTPPPRTIDVAPPTSVSMPAKSVEAPAPAPVEPPRSTPVVPASLTPPRGLAPAAAPAAVPAASVETPKAVESDAPVARRRQTLLGVLPGEPNKPPAPNLPSLTTVAPPTGAPAPAMPRTGLPTRATRLDLPATGGSPAPNTAAPVFKAPPAPKPDDKKG